MTAPDYASLWRDAMKRAGQLHPDRIAAHIIAASDTGLRATRYDSTGGGRTTRVECRDEGCEDGKPGTHSHLVTSDPTGNAATRNHRSDSSTDDLRLLNRASIDFVTAANAVLWWVCGDRAKDWADVVRINAKLMPGTVQAGLDVDDDYRLPPAIAKVEQAVEMVEDIARDHLPRAPSQDEQYWDDRLYNDNDVCAWHLAIHRRYRRPRAGGTNCCQACLTLAELGGAKPPAWLLEAEVDRESKPKAWHQALSRWLDEQGVPAHERSA